MKKFLFILALIPLLTFGQSEAHRLWDRHGNFINHPQINDLFESKTDQAYYEVEDWRAGRMIMGKYSTISFPVRINLLNNSAEVKLKESEIVELPLSKIDGVQIFQNNSGGVDTTTYVNSTFLNSSSKPFLMEILYSDEITLLKRIKVRLRRATYNKALGTGRKEDSFDVKTIYYLFDGDELIEVPKKKKKAQKLFSKYEGLMDDLVIYDKELYQLLN